MLLAVVQHVSPTLADSERACLEETRTVEATNVTALAGTWANLRGTEDSLRFQSDRILKSAVANIATLTPPADVCQEPCKLAPRPRIVLTSVPAKFLERYGDLETCNKMLERTSSQPFRYFDRSFKDIESLGAWFSDLSTGAGKDGEDLYQKCSGSCSPQYKLLILETPDGYRADAEVICGHARDKDDNHYKLMQSYLWSCAEANNLKP